MVALVFVPVLREEETGKFSSQQHPVQCFCNLVLTSPFICLSLDTVNGEHANKGYDGGAMMARYGNRGLVVFLCLENILHACPLH